jgi:hypothetical protein
VIPTSTIFTSHHPIIPTFVHVTARGSLNSMTAGHLHALYTDAAALAPQESALNPPAISIVTDHSYV